MRTYLVIMFGLLSFGLATHAGITLAEDATFRTYTNSTIEQIDPETRKVTFRTLEGQTWSLEATSADLLKGVQKGDRVSLELDSDDRVKKIVKGEPSGGQTGSETPRE